MTNKYTEIHTALKAKQNDLAKTYGNDPRLSTIEGKMGLVIMQLDNLTIVVDAMLKQLGDKVEQNSRN